MYDRVLAVTVTLLALAAAHADESPLRDPMQPYRPAEVAAAARPAGPRYDLTAVLIASARRVAVVNGKLYRQGDRVNGAEIIRIEPQAVHLRDGSKDLVVRLSPQPAPAPISGEGDSGS